MSLDLDEATRSGLLFSQEHDIGHVSTRNITLGARKQSTITQNIVEKRVK